MKKFRTKTHGKWILSGEHAVLRGGKALVFPLMGLSLDFEFEADASEIILKGDGEHGKDLQFLFWSVLEKAGVLFDRRQSDFRGTFRICNQIPIGAGLGASAAFCVGFARWMAWKNWIPEQKIEAVAKDLENIFHGESSGVDIAIAHSGLPLCFVKNSEPVPLKMNWQPNLWLAYSGQKGLTRECVERVKTLIQEKPELGQKIDQKMMASAEQAKLSLEESGPEALKNLVLSMDLASSCFEEWQLIDGSCKAKINSLKKLGAISVKPTGSGGGGYLLCLWPHGHQPSSDLNLISCF